MIYASRSKQGFLDPSICELMPEDAVEITDEKHNELRDGQSGKRINFDTESGIPELVDLEVVYLTGHELAEKVNGEVAQVYSTWTRFEAEYVFRENAANAYKAANYTGTASVWITAFATAAGLSARIACDLILSQAVGLRAAQESLGALRMRKYELLPLAEQEALDKYNEIHGAIQQVVSLIS
ncbi:hypothetical protein [Pseudomonas laurylsulfatiphila]|uniref:hypothetical protein n=1 Tax=Pseudomonas laurylsulfatiphila TaxID=2011015 RepID=UPI003D246947